MILGSCPVAVTSPSDFSPASSKEFLDIQATIECGFTLKRVRDMTRTYSQMNLLVGQRLQDVNLMKRKINLIITEEKIRENLEELLTANVT